MVAPSESIPKPVKVAQVVHSLGAGGTERLVIDLCLALAPLAELQVLCLDEPRVWARQLTDHGIPVTALGRTPGFDIGLARAIAREFRAWKPDVVHCHHYAPYVYGTLGSLMSIRAKVIYTEHGRLSDAPWSWKRKLANNLFGRLPGCFFAVSHDLRNYMIEGGMPAHRMEVIYNGIPPGDPPGAAERQDARARLGLPESAYVAGTVARLDPVKDLPSLLEAFCALRASRPDASLVIVGDGDERASLETDAKRRGIANAVHFTGQRDDARDLLPAFDVYVNCSITEGVSVTILEAMAASRPVVVTRVGGTPEVVEHDVTGWLVPARVPTELGSALCHLAENDALASRLARAARAHVESQFATQTMLSRYLSIYGIAPPCQMIPTGSS